MFSPKLLLVGPSESGKTVLANFLSDATEAIGGDYNPTQGVRILEFECLNVNAGGRNVGCEVELWDCSGDQKFETCWPALMKDSNGVIIVFNDIPSHLKEIEMFYSYFVQQQRLHDSQCLLIAHHKPSSATGRNRPNLDPSFLPLLIAQRLPDHLWLLPYSPATKQAAFDPFKPGGGSGTSPHSFPSVLGNGC
ncbi:intraflagellar transport protein 22 homolog isoform X1 [Mobula birostris]|uniref:intraflagellar transport protein 22 homolog isoform X1 n=1 Tax=Mobula birostris TaxID=1983395 RepID=UPI003B2834D4